MPPQNEFFLGSENENRGADRSLRVRLRTYQIPPIKDAAVIGREAPVGRKVMMETLRLTSREPFEAIDIRDHTVGAIVVRQAILCKISWEMVKRIVLRKIKPLMTKTEILALHLEIEVALGESF